MKNLRFFILGLVSLTTSTFFSSCDKEDDPVAAPNVTLDITNEQEEYQVGQNLNVTINFTSEAGIVAMSRVILDGSTILGERLVIDLNEEGLANQTSGTFTFVQPISEAMEGKDLTLEFQIENEFGALGKDTVSFTVAESRPVVAHQQTLLGGQSNNSEPSFYNAIDNARYSYTNMRDVNSASTDFTFFYGGTTGNLYTLAALDDDDANNAFSTALSVNNALGSSIINFRNQTRFSPTTMSAAEFDAISNERELLTSASFETGTTKANQLLEGQVYAIKLDGGRRAGRFGLVKIVNTTGTSGADRAVTIEVKIQDGNN